MTSAYVRAEGFGEYSRRFSEHFVMERDDDGVLVVRMHTDGGPAIWSPQMHNALGRMLRVVGEDRDNQVAIFTGTGDLWLAGRDPDAFDEIEYSDSVFREVSYDRWFYDGSQIIKNAVDLDIPTIGILNGPGFHWEVPLLCDITLCADDVTLRDRHYPYGIVPGDGQFLIWQHLMGAKRASYAAYFGLKIPAQQLKDWGLVNEVLPRGELLIRARELARRLLRPHPSVRRLATQVVKRPWHRLLADDLGFHLSHELWGAMVHRNPHSSFAEIDREIDREQ